MKYPTKSPYEYETEGYTYSIIDGFVYDKDCVNIPFAMDIATGAIFYPNIAMDEKIESDTKWYLDSVPIVTRKLVGHKRHVAMVPRKKGQRYG